MAGRGGMNIFSRLLGVFVATAMLVTSTFIDARESTSVAGKAVDHSHIPIAVPMNVQLPQLSLSLYRDAVSGFNLELHIARFALGSPPWGATANELMAAAIDPVNGFVAGHAHLYINAEKVQRLYGTDVHLPSSLFRAGVNQVTVSLNNHGHMFWTGDDRQILATLFVDLEKESPVLYRFESFPIAVK